MARWTLNIRATSPAAVPSSSRRRAKRYLVGGQLGWPTEAHATLHGRRPACPGALLDQRPLELGDAGKHGQHHAPGRAGRVGPGLAEGAQAGAGLTQLLGDPQQVAGRARQAVEAVDHDHVLLAHLVEQARQLRPVAPGAGELLLVEAPATGLLQRGALQGEVLVVRIIQQYCGRDPARIRAASADCREIPASDVDHPAHAEHMTAYKLADDHANVVIAADRHGCESQARMPAFGTKYPPKTPSSSRLSSSSGGRRK